MFILIQNKRIFIRFFQQFLSSFVHRDLKPQNFMIDRSRIYLIDFEQSKSFLLSNGRHIIPGETRCLFGSMMFTSINSHFYKEMSRKDDMESLAYILCYFLHGRLPWNFYEHLRMDLMQKSLKIGSMKQSLLPHILFENCPIEFSDFLRSKLFSLIFLRLNLILL